MFKAERAEEVKPQPKLSRDEAEVLEYFSKRIGDSADACRAVEDPAAEAQAREAGLKAQLAEAHGAIGARDARIAELEGELARMRERLESVTRESVRLRGECGRLSGELKKPGEETDRSAAEGVRAAPERSAAPAESILDSVEGIREVFPGELREQILTTLEEEASRARQCGRLRRAGLLEAVLKANGPTGELERRRDALKQILKDAGSFTDDRALAELRGLGIRCISGRRHWKLEYGEIRMPIAKTPSDCRAGRNAAASIGNICF